MCQRLFSKEATMSATNPFKFVGGLLLEIGAVIAVLALLPAFSARDPFGLSTPASSALSTPAAARAADDFFAPNSLRMLDERNLRERPSPAYTAPARQPDYSRQAPPPAFPREAYVHEARPLVRDFAPEPRTTQSFTVHGNINRDRGDLLPPSFTPSERYAPVSAYAEQPLPYQATQYQRQTYRPSYDAPVPYERAELRSRAYDSRY
jgi:hypothetical protein